MRPISMALLVVAAAAVIWFLEWIGGSTYPLDVAAIRDGVGWRQAHPEATGAIIFYTHLGSAWVLLPAAIGGALWLWWRSKRARAAALLASVIGVRLGVEVLKFVVDRARPSLDAHPVVVHSQSFPSGHASNSMATFLALALFVTPERWRRPAVALAFVAALAMGATRPLLGVHWPSDVLAGWVFGAAVTLLMWWWLSRRGDRNAA